MKKTIPQTLRGDVRLAILETGAMGPIGAFSSVADIASIAGWWGYLLVCYARHYHYSIDAEMAKRLCTTAIMGMGGYYFGCKTATRLFNLIPGAGTLAAMGLSSLENMVFTYRFALTLSSIFGAGRVSFDTLADSVRCMFAGTSQGFASVKDIACLCIGR